MKMLNVFQVYDNYPNTRPILYAVFTIIEFIFFGYYLYKSLTRPIFKRLLLISSAFFIIIAAINLYYIVFLSNTSQLIDTIPVSTSAILLIVFSILYLFEEIQSPKIGFIYSNPKFWIVVGIMIYFSGTFFLFLQFSDLSSSDQDNFWTINLICIMLKNIFFTISFILPKENNNQIELENSFNKY